MLNRVILMGRLTKDVELKTSQSGTSFASLTVAVERKLSKEKETDFINCKAFGKTAENLAKFFSKGNMILLEGRIQTGSYEKDGKKVYTTDVMIDGFCFTGEKKDKQESNQEPSFVVADNMSDDDLPFN